METTVGNDQLWQLTMQSSPVGMSLVAPDGQLLMVNPAFCAMLGYDAETLVAMAFYEITHPDDLERDLQHFEETLTGARTSYRLFKRFVHADGHVVWGDLSVAVVRDDDGFPVHLISQVVDVTDREEALQRLAAAEATIDLQRLMAQAVYETVDVGLLLVDASGHYEAMNRRHREFMALAFPDGHQGQAGQTGEVYAEDGATPLPGEKMPSHRAACGEEFDDVRVWVGADPVSRVALSVSGRTVRDARGALVGAALAYKDVTEYVRALAVKDDFVALVSQELRTPLSSVLGHLEMVVESGDLPSELAERMVVVERNAFRMRSLVENLLQVVQGAGTLPIRRTDADLSHVVTAALEDARAAGAAAKVALVADVPESLPAVVDPARIRQVLDTLVSNGIAAAGAGGTLRVALALVEDRVEMKVAEATRGIDPRDLDRPFRGPAQDLNTPGTGLGLTIVRSIVEAHGGTLSRDSAVGVGSVVRVSLPRSPRHDC